MWFAPCTRRPRRFPERLRLALCAREVVDDAPPDLLAVTADDILPLP